MSCTAYILYTFHLSWQFCPILSKTGSLRKSWYMFLQFKKKLYFSQPVCEKYTFFEKKKIKMYVFSCGFNNNPFFNYTYISDPLHQNVKTVKNKYVFSFMSSLVPHPHLLRRMLQKETK